MTGYSKIKKTKLRKYVVGGNPNDPDQEQSDGNFFGDNTKAITGGANFLGDTVDSFNKGGTGGGSVALGTLSGGLKGAAAGTAILPGIGTAVGAGVGLVSGFFSSEAKRKQALIQRGQQQAAQAGVAKQQSNQVLRQYANNGVENEQLFAIGGTIDPPLSNKFKTEWNGFAGWMKQNGYSNNPNLDIRTQNTGKQYLNQYINNNHTTQLSPDSVGRVQQELQDYRNTTLNRVKSGKGELAPGVTPDNYMSNISPVDSWLGTKTSQETFPKALFNSKSLGYSNPNLTTEQQLTSTKYAKGGSIHIKPSHKGRFTAYKERTGETTAEALHSKNPHVRKMANFARNAAHFKRGYGGMVNVFDDGGNPTADEQVDPQYEAEGSEVVQGNAQMENPTTPLASDMQQINGPSHEQGGVMGQGGDRIFSDRLKISPNLKDVLRTSGIKVGANSTYADVSNKLGKLKGKFEDKTDGVGKQTATLMLPKIEQSLDATFNDQEAGKNMRAYKKFAKGGSPAKAMDNGAFSIPNTFDDGGNIPIRNLNVPSAPLATTQTPVPYDDSTDEVQQPSSAISTPQSIISKVGDFVNNNEGQVANAGTYLANLGTINRLSTSVNPSYLSTPNYNYVDRSGSAINRNSALLRTGVKGLTNNGNSVNASNIAALFAKTQEGNSYISAQENARKDTYNNNYNERADKINAENTGIYNKAQDDTRDLYNQKVAARLSARNAFQTGVVGNIAAKQSADLEQKKLLTVLAANDQNGVMTRFLKNYPQYKSLLAQYNSTSN